MLYPGFIHYNHFHLLGCLNSAVEKVDSSITKFRDATEGSGEVVRWWVFCRYGPMKCVTASLCGHKLYPELSMPLGLEHCKFFFHWSRAVGSLLLTHWGVTRKPKRVHQSCCLKLFCKSRRGLCFAEDFVYRHERGIPLREDLCFKWKNLAPITSRILTGVCSVVDKAQHFLYTVWDP